MFFNSMILLNGNAGGTGEGSGGLLESMGMFLPLILLGVVFFFFIIRPESKRKKAAAKLLSELIVGDEVTTIGGLVGKIVQLKDDSAVIESGPERTRVKILRWAIKGKGESAPEK